MNIEQPAKSVKTKTFDQYFSNSVLVTASEAGLKIANKIADLCSPRPPIYATNRIAEKSNGEIQPAGRLKPFFDEAFRQYDTIICIMACGIVVRSIGDAIRHKQEDPAVLVIDPAGEFVISLLSGHLGEANEKARALAEKISATPVITTASDQLGYEAIDSFCQSQGYAFDNFEKAKDLASRVIEGKRIFQLNLDSKADCFPNADLIDSDFFIRQPDYCLKQGLLVFAPSWHSPFTSDDALICYPKNLVLGAGCRKEIDPDLFEAQVLKLCEKNSCPIQAISKIATIALKQHEKAIVELAHKLKAKIVIVPKDEMDAVQDNFPENSFVHRVTGFHAVSEAAGYAASGYGTMLKETLKEKGVRICLYEEKNES